MKKRLSTQFFILLSALLIVACSGLTQSAAPAANSSATAAALAQTANALGTREAWAAMASTPATTLQDTATPWVITATSEPTQPQTATPTWTETPTLPPTDTPTPTETASATPLPSNTPPPSETPTLDLQTRIRTANVLVYDEPDSEELARLVPRSSRYLPEMGFSGGKVVNATNALGRFTTLLKNEPWDLVILAVENRGRPELQKLGLLNEIVDHLNSGGALIVEVWNLDDDESTLARYLLDVCGARVENDWYRSEDYVYDQFLLTPRDPYSPVLQGPAALNLPMRPNVFWKQDVGDLIHILYPEKGGRILLGLNTQEEGQHYGLVTSCLNGRMILQTFSSHDYSLYDSVNLWKNMIVYTLTNHFAILP